MGRKRSWLVRKHFLSNTQNSAQICQIENCGLSVTGNNVTNLRRHIETKHKNIFLQLLMEEDPEPPIKKNQLSSITIQTSEDTLWEGCLDMVASGLSFSFINNIGFKKIINPIVEKINVKEQFNSCNLVKKNK